MESTWTIAGVWTLYVESTWSLPGVQTQYQEFTWTPDGVHQDPWGSVTYRDTMIFSMETIAMTMMTSQSKMALKTESVFEDYKLRIRPLKTKGKADPPPMSYISLFTSFNPR